MTHLLREVNTLYTNEGAGLFTDLTVGTGLGTASIGFTGFGTRFLDVDNDGWLDILTVNGAVRTIEEQRRAGDPLPLKQPNQLFLNVDGRFVESSDRAPVLARLTVSRGVAVGDVDNDGDPDVLVTNNGGPTALLLNHVGDDSHWLGLELVGRVARRGRPEAPVPARDDRGRGQAPSARPARPVEALTV